MLAVCECSSSSQIAADGEMWRVAAGGPEQQEGGTSRFLPSGGHPGQYLAADSAVIRKLVG